MSSENPVRPLAPGCKEDEDHAKVRRAMGHLVSNARGSPRVLVGRNRQVGGRLAAFAPARRFGGRGVGLIFIVTSPGFDMDTKNP